jgi:hypothetical protein
MTADCAAGRTVDPSAPPARRWQRENRLTFGPYPDTVPTARTHTKVVLGEWGLTGELAGDVLTVLSELVSNALQATWQWGLHAPVDVRLAADNEWLIVEVRDCVQNAAPDLRHIPESERGRGLVVIDHLSYRWGYFHPPDGDKAVFALFRL